MGNHHCCRRKVPAPATLADALSVSSADSTDATSRLGVAPSEQAYVNRMLPLLFAGVDLSLDAALMAMAKEEDGALARSRTRALGKELCELKANLPCTASSSIFVRYDKKRPQFIKALIVGPEDSAYDAGVFVFDIYVPPAYPAVPPHVLLRTTDGGRVRFNPNLYACGKVCLSLLGTWSGTHASQNWTSNSTILQVLVSIQGLILVREPYYNEPGREGSKLQPNDHNLLFCGNGGTHVVRMETLRVAIADACVKPITPFEEVTRAHFSLRRDYVQQMANRWCKEPWLKTAVVGAAKLSAAEDTRMRVQHALKTLPAASFEASLSRCKPPSELGGTGASSPDRAPGDTGAPVPAMGGAGGEPTFPPSATGTVTRAKSAATAPAPVCVSAPKQAPKAQAAAHHRVGTAGRGKH